MPREVLADRGAARLPGVQREDHRPTLRGTFLRAATSVLVARVWEERPIDWEERPIDERPIDRFGEGHDGKS